MDETNERIEQQLTMLMRRVQRIHLSTSSGDMDLDRSAYGILCQLVDEGPQRVGALAGVFGLDPSTITRQVQALERAGLVARRVDQEDRRASILELTDEGRSALQRTRTYRRERFEQVLADWPQEDRDQLARLLERFNGDISLIANRG